MTYKPSNLDDLCSKFADVYAVLSHKVLITSLEWFVEEPWSV